MTDDQTAAPAAPQTPAELAAAAAVERAPRRIDYVPLDDLKGDPRNPKSHDLALIDSSYSRFGVVDLITVDGRTGFIISGHGRTTTLKDAFARGDTAPEGVLIADDGTWLIPVNAGWASKNDTEAAAALISLNRLTEMGGWVDESLLELLEEIGESGEGFDGIGYSETDLDDLRHLLEEVPDLDSLADEFDPDNVPGSGGAKGVTIKLTDAGAIDAWHTVRDTFKNDDDALRSLLGLDPATKPTAASKAGKGRTSNPSLDDLEDASGGVTVIGSVPTPELDPANPVGQGSLSQQYALELAEGEIDEAAGEGAIEDDETIEAKPEGIRIFQPGSDEDGFGGDAPEPEDDEEGSEAGDGLDWSTAATIPDADEAIEEDDVELDLSDFNAAATPDDAQARADEHAAHDPQAE